MWRIATGFAAGRIAHFNRGEYFEQHETLEVLWRTERRDVRRLYQGILQIGVAFRHLRRANHHGTMCMLGRGAAVPGTICSAMPGRRCRSAAGRCAAALKEVERLGLAGFDWRLAPTVRVNVGCLAQLMFVSKEVIV
jgi:hypothetical protein